MSGFKNCYVARSCYGCSIYKYCICIEVECLRSYCCIDGPVEGGTTNSADIIDNILVSDTYLIATRDWLRYWFGINDDDYRSCCSCTTELAHRSNCICCKNRCCRIIMDLVIDMKCSGGICNDIYTGSPLY